MFTELRAASTAHNRVGLSLWEHLSPLMRLVDRAQLHSNIQWHQNSVAGELLKLLNSKLMTLSESLQRKSLRLAWGARLGDIDVMFSVWRNHRSASFKVVSDCQTIRLFKRDNNAADRKQTCGGIDALINQRAVGLTHIDSPSSGLQHPVRH